MGRGKRILSLAMCAVLALALGACGGSAKGGDDSSSSTLFEKGTAKREPSKRLQSGTDLSGYEASVTKAWATTSMSSNVDAFTYDEPQGWQKETTDKFVIYKKADAKGLQAVIVVAQGMGDAAAEAADMGRLAANAHYAYMRGIVQSDACSVREGNLSYSSSANLTSDECYVDGCGVEAGDCLVTGHPSFGNCRGGVLAVGAADASLVVGFVSSDSAYNGAAAAFRKLEASAHVTTDELQKVRTLAGDDVTVGNSFADKPLS